ncbi:MAG: hypothetical protein ACXW32_12130 [Limisphaerales bacterium]
MSVDPKEQNAELARLIGANKQRLAHTQKMLRDLHKRTSSETPRKAPPRNDRDKG